jgi:nicotinamide riboside kinase
MKKIAIFGTHGSAKTTLVYKLAAFYKMGNKNVTVIHEAARQSPFPINLDVVYQTTLFVVTSQIKKELQAEAEGFEISISDRTPSDAFIYLNHLKRDNSFTRSLEIFCLEWMKKYDVLIYLEPSEGFLIKEDGIRAVGIEYQNKIRDDFRVLLKEIRKNKNINFIEANAAQLFDEEESQILMNKINRSLYVQSREVNLV